MYYGLGAIRNFKDKKDLPYYRAMVPWLLRNQFDQAAEECVYMMEYFPASENLPVLKSIWVDYKSRQVEKANEPLLPIYLARALAASKSADAIPILTEMLENDRAHDTALIAIRDIKEATAPQAGGKGQ